MAPVPNKPFGLIFQYFFCCHRCGTGATAYGNARGSDRYRSKNRLLALLFRWSCQNNTILFIVYTCIDHCCGLPYIYARCRFILINIVLRPHYPSFQPQGRQRAIG